MQNTAQEAVVDTMKPETQSNASAHEWIENVTFDELRVGQSAQMTRQVSGQDILAFAAVSGDVNPAHLDVAYARDTLFHGVIAHGMLGRALISAVLGTQLPGPGTIYLEQSLQFMRPVHIGDELTASVTVASLEAAKKRVTLDCEVTNQKGERVISGKAYVMAPVAKVRQPRPSLVLPHIEPPAAFTVA